MITMITGGQRSGKSDFALKLALDYPPPRLFVATALALDDEMKERIKRHRAQRGEDFTTVEEPVNIAAVIDKASYYNVIVIDCLTLWVNNLFMNGIHGQWRKKVDEVIASTVGKRCIFVSNEVGMGIVPANDLSRRFADLLGMVNRRMVDAAEEFYFMVSGVPLRLIPR